MRLAVIFLIFISTLVPAALPANGAVLNAVEIHVSTVGNDITGDGSQLNPYLTLTRAKTAVNNLKNPTTPVDVLIHGGTYRNYATTFTHDDRGYQNAPVTYKAFDDGEVIFTGSIPIESTGFSISSDQRIRDEVKGRVLEADISNIIASPISYPVPFDSFTILDSYYELYSGDTMQTLARYPNGGYTLTGSIINDGVSSGKPEFTFTDSRKNDWASSAGAILSGYWGHDWAFHPVLLDSVTTNGLKLNSKPWYGVRNKARFYISNLLSELDMPNEWYLDVQSRKLFYYPLEDDFNLEISASSTPPFRFLGSSYINIEGITIKNYRGYGVEMAYSGRSCDNINIKNCNFFNIGNTAIYTDNITNASIYGCNIYNIGGRGIVLSGGNTVTLTVGNNRVENCHIYNFARLYKTYAAAIDIFGTGNTVIKNAIHDSPHMAIRFGGNDHIIEYNEIYNVTRESSDSGSIYTGRSWTGRGTSVSHNYFHDSITDVPESGGLNAEMIYIDDLQCGTIMTGNVLFNGNRGALIGGGRENKFFNNIIIDNSLGMTYDNRGMKGEWSNGSTLFNGGANGTQGDVYRSLMELINNPNYNQALWESKYPGFTAHILEAQNQTASPNNSAYDAGTPRNAVVKNNIFVGSRVNASGYINIKTAVSQNSGGEVKNNKTYLTKEEIGFVDLPNQNFKLAQGSKIFNELPEFQNVDFENMGLKSSENVHIGLEKAVPLFPEAGGSVKGKKTEFFWTKPNGADKFRLVIAKNAAMNAPILSIETKYPNQVVENLPGGTLYFRVDSINISKNIGETKLGDVQSFTSYGIEIEGLTPKNGNAEIKFSSTENKTAMVIFTENIGNRITAVRVGYENLPKGESTISYPLSGALPAGGHYRVFVLKDAMNFVPLCESKKY